MKKSMLMGAALLMSAVAPALHAQEKSEPKFEFKPGARILADGALFFPQKNGFTDGVAIPEIRIGAKMTYGKWHACVDVGYGYGKLSMKDVYLQYKFNENNLIRGGYFIQPFGLQSATSSSMKASFEAPITDSYVGAGSRNLGIMYLYDDGPFFAGVSAIAGTKLTESADKAGKISLGGMTRLVWRPLAEKGRVAQVGISGWYQSAFHQQTENEDGEHKISDGYFNYSANYPTRVDQITLLETDIRNARGTFKLSPELLLSKGRLGLEAQYYYMNVNRKDGPAFVSQGAYGLLRCLIIGDKSYSYSPSIACLATPKPKTLECVLGYNYTNASSSKAGIFGGVSNDYSVTFNYYINKYMIARLRWSYTDQRNIPGSPKEHVNILEARVQFIY